MSFNRETRLTLLRERAGHYVNVARDGITREFPVMPAFVATGPGPYPSHRELHPAFYGCFDWHSCVAMQWAVVRLLRLSPDKVPLARARGTLNDLLTDANIATETAFFADPNHRSLERPYGWGWLLALHHELSAWDDPDGRRWARTVEPLADLLAANFARWLGVMTYPQRTGVHSNTAFGMSRAYDAARARAAGGDPRLLSAIHESAHRWFAADADYPARFEPSGADFLSAALSEAELMSRILDTGFFSGWLKRFLPDIEHGMPGELFEPATVADASDGQIAHLHGLNLSRAWAFAAIAERLPAEDSRIAPMLMAAERHAAASLPRVSGSNYAVEHWLAAYATLLLG